MATPPLPDGLANNRTNRVANKLHSASIHLLRRARTVDREAGLTAERLSLLSVLSFAGSRTVSQLADIEFVSRPAISRILNSLEDAGLVRREKTSKDRRIVRVHATPKGKKLMESARQRRLEIIAQELAGFDSAVLVTLEQAATILESLDE